MTVVLTESNGTTFVFDGGVTWSVSEESEASKHPVERGADITDHVQLQPRKVTVKGGLTDSPLLPGTPYPGRNQQRLDELRRLHQTGEPVTLSADLDVFPSMLIVGLSFDRVTTKAVQVEISLEEIIIAEATLVDLPASILSGRAAQRSSEAEVGAVVGAAADANSSAAASGQAQDALNGAGTDSQPGGSILAGLF